MGRLADAVVNDVLDALFGNQPTDIPATHYIGLSLTPPTNNGGNVTEPDTANGYARVSFANNATNWTTAATRAKSNATIITFPTATGAWGLITHYVIWRHATSTATADFVGWGQLDSPQSVTTGGIAAFPINALTIDAPGA